MASSTAEIRVSPATAVSVTDDALTLDLADGRTISVPLEWFPRLVHATPAERANARIAGDGIHWPELDEDISVEGLLAGRASSESQASLKKWIQNRAKAKA